MSHQKNFSFFYDKLVLNIFLQYERFETIEELDLLFNWGIHRLQSWWSNSSNNELFIDSSNPYTMAGTKPEQREWSWL